jgi:hypothetical protein
VYKNSSWQQQHCWHPIQCIKSFLDEKENCHYLSGFLRSSFISKVFRPHFVTLQPSSKMD